MEGLKKIGFQESSYDMCLLWRNNCILVIYTDDTIVAGINEEAVTEAITDISKEFTITSNEIVSDFLGVNISFNEAK
jgi:hypothetical protein